MCSENPSPTTDSWQLNMNWLKAVEPSAVETRCEVCPLTHVKAGVAVRIKQLCASPELQNRLRELGLCEDQIIRLLTSQSNFICQVCNARLAISQQLAQLIMVEPVRPALN
jgi:ferrous iron transport protein A